MAPTDPQNYRSILPVRKYSNISDNSPSPIMTRKPFPKGKLSLFSTPGLVVTFLIGPEHDKFILHKDFVCHYSPVLNAAFNSNFIEGQTQTYTLNDTTPGAFVLLTQWMYTQNIELIQLRGRDQTMDNTAYNEESSHERESLVELWVLGDKLQIPTLQNLVIRSMIMISERHGTIDAYALNYIYKNTAVDSPLRNFYVVLCALFLAFEIFQQKPELFPQEFLLELVIYTRKVLIDGDGKIKMLKIEDYYVSID